MKEAEKAFNAANLGDEQTIAAIAARGRNREMRERLEREKVERERLAKAREWEQMQREEKAEKARKAFGEQQARAQAAELARDEVYRRMERSRMNGIYFGFDNGGTRQDYPLACDHGGWWDKVQRRTACPRCCDMWNYLLQCPGCEKRACPKCQSELRPKFHRNTARTSRRGVPRPRFSRPYGAH